MAEQKKKAPASKKTPPKQLMLVVHGLGEQGPGETLDDLAGGLWGDDDELRVSSDVRLMQDVKQLDDRKLQTFPCNVRRYSDKSDPENVHTTFAEVYWADLSRGDEGLIKTIYGLIKAILGLGHIVRAGAKQYFSKSPFSQWVANLIPYLLHGPIAGVNVALAAGILAAFAMTWMIGELSPLWVAGTLIFTGALLAWIAGSISRKHHVYYFRIFTGWVAFYGFLLVVLSLGTLAGLPDDGQREWLARVLLDPQPGDPIADKLSTGLFWYGVVLVGCLKFAWILTMAALLYVAGSTLRYFPQRHPDAKEFLEKDIGQVPPLVLIIPCAMIWLWMLVLSTIWVSVTERGWFEGQIDKQLLAEGVSLLFFTQLCAALILAVAIIALLRRSSWKKGFEKRLKDRSPEGVTACFKDKPIKRLLLSGWIVFGIIATGIFLFWAVMSKVLDGNKDAWYNLEIIVTRLFDLDGAPGMLDLAIKIAVVLGAVAVYLQSGLGRGLGVAKDLITYFKEEPKDQAMGALGMPVSSEFEVYPQRDLIHGRMQKVLQALWAENTFDDVVVISHSQGTIIATEFIKDLQKPTGLLVTDKNLHTKLRQALQGATLVTMGSPFTHVYNHYLPGQFAGPEAVLGPDVPESKRKKGEKELIAKWINIFRVDDFIGTYIGNDFPGDRHSGAEGSAGQAGNGDDGQTAGATANGEESSKARVEWPVNMAVEAGGHTGYWSDKRVTELLRKHVVKYKKDEE